MMIVIMMKIAVKIDDMIASLPTDHHYDDDDPIVHAGGGGQIMFGQCPNGWKSSKRVF